MRDSTQAFEKGWNHIDTRVGLVPGKDVLSRLNRHLQETYGVNLTARMIVAEMAPDEVPRDLVRLLRDLEHFRTSAV